MACEKENQWTEVANHQIKYNVRMQLMFHNNVFALFSVLPPPLPKPNICEEEEELLKN